MRITCICPGAVAAMRLAGSARNRGVADAGLLTGSLPVCILSSPFTVFSWVCNRSITRFLIVLLTTYWGCVIFWTQDRGYGLNAGSKASGFLWIRCGVLKLVLTNCRGPEHRLEITPMMHAACYINAINQKVVGGLKTAVIAGRVRLAQKKLTNASVRAVGSQPHPR